MPVETSSVTPLSGAQYPISGHGYTATIASVGAALRTLRFRGRDLVRPFGQDELHTNFSGAVLAPWPNRVIDAAYTWDDEGRQLDISEPARGHALHGLVVWQNFEAVEWTDSAVSLSTVIEPRAGYPHRVRLDVEYALGPDGLTTSVSAKLLAGEPAPFGWGSHSYLVAPAPAGETEPVNGWTLALPAGTVQTVTPDRLVPTGTAPVDHEGLDFREAAPIGDTFIDHAFTDLTRDTDSRATARLTDASGVGVAMTWGTECPWVQVHTADLDDPATSRTGLAVEPMTCPPGAFNSGTDLIRLTPDEDAAASWTLAAIGD